MRLAFSEKSTTSYGLSGFFGGSTGKPLPRRFPAGTGQLKNVPEWLQVAPRQNGVLLHECIVMKSPELKKTYIIVIQEAEGRFYTYAANGTGTELHQTCRKNKLLITSTKEDALKHAVKMFNHKKAHYGSIKEWSIDTKTQKTIDILKKLDPSQVHDAFGICQ